MSSEQEQRKLPKASILNLLGFSMAGYAFGAEFLKARRRSKESAGIFAKAVKEFGNQSGTVLETVLQPNIDELGLTGLRYIGKEIEITDLANTFLAKDEHFIKSLSDLAEILKHKELELGFEQFDNGAIRMFLKRNNKELINIGYLADNGIVRRPDTLGRYFVYRNKFLTASGTKKILAMEGSLKEILEKEAISYNAALTQKVSELLQTNLTAAEIEEEIRLFTSKHRGASKGINPIMQTITKESIVADASAFVHPEDIEKFIVNFAEMAKREGATLNPILLKNVDDISSGILNNPFINLDEQLKAMGFTDSEISILHNQFSNFDLRPEDNKALRQLLLRETTNEQNKLINKINVLYVSQDDKIFDMLNMLGVGNRGVAGPVLEEEGYLVSAGKYFTRTSDIHYITLPIEGHITKETQIFLNDLKNIAIATDPSLASKSLKETLMAITTDTELRQKVLENFSKTFKHNRIILNEYFKDRVLQETATGRIAIDTNVTNVLLDIGLSDKGLVFKIETHGTSDKIWGTAKALKDTIADTRQFGRTYLTIQDLLENNLTQEEYKQLNKYLNYAKKQFNATTLEEQVTSLLQNALTGNKTAKKFLIDVEKVARQRYKDLPDLYITHQPVRGKNALHELAAEETQQMLDQLSQTSSSTANNLKRFAITTAEDSKALEESGRKAAFFVGYESYAPESNQYGFESTQRVNHILYDRLKVTNRPIAAQYISSMFDIETANKLTKAYSILLDNYGVPAVEIDIDTVLNKQLNILFGDDIQAAQQLAKELSGLKDIPEDAVFYLSKTIDGQKYKIPIPLIQSRWSGEVTRKGLYPGQISASEGDTIYKTLSAESLRMSRILRQSNFYTQEELAKAYSNFMDTVLNVAFDYRNYTHIPTAEASLYQLRAGYYLTEKHLENLYNKIGEKQFTDFMQRWGFDANLIDFEILRNKEISDKSAAFKRLLEDIHGYSTETYFKRVKDTDVFKRVAIRELGLDKTIDDISKITSDEIINIIKERQKGNKLIQPHPDSLLRKILRKTSQEGVYEIILRNPMYSLEGATVSRAIDLETFAVEFNKLMGVPVNDAAKRVKTSIRNFAIYAPGRLRRVLQADLDNDPITAIRIKNEEMMRRIVREHQSFAQMTENFNPLIRQVYLEAQKGGLKMLTFSDLFNYQPKSTIEEIAKLSRVEAEYIGRLYNASRGYSAAYNYMLLEKLSQIKNPSLDALNRLYAWEHFINILPEMAIGSKAITTPETAEQVLNLFREGIPVEEKISTFKKIVSTGDPSKWSVTLDSGQKVNIFDLFTDADFEAIFSAGEEFSKKHAAEIKMATHQIDKFTIKRFLANASKMAEGSKINDAGIGLLREAAPKTTSSLGSIADDLGETLFNVAKNKWLWAGIGTGLAGAILVKARHRADNKAMEMQDAREESHIRSKNTPATAIDKQYALVEPIQPYKKGLANITVTNNSGFSIGRLFNKIGNLFGTDNIQANVYANRRASNERLEAERLITEQQLNRWHH